MTDSLLKISNYQLLNQFLHDCVDNLTGRRSVNFENYSSDIAWTNEDYTAATRFIQNLYRESSRNADLKLDGDLSENVAESIRNCYELRKSEIEQAVLKEHLMQNGNVVENVDWKLKWVMGSSQIATLREPLLQLDLHCFKKKGRPRETLNFEMNLEQVDRLISELQNAKDDLVNKI